jgi:Zn-dependent peptidase ImmA (M78 family)
MQPRKSFIRRAAIALLKRCKISEPPVDLLQIVKQCGLEYEEVDYFDDDVDALIIPYDGKIVAAVNQNSSVNRRRFSLAHELCHHLYHQDRSMLIESMTVDIEEGFDESSSKDPFESEADAFAGELLVPLPMLKKHYRPGHTAADIGQIFQVSEHVASIALTSHFDALFK